jgi:hypothetical protein
MSFHRILTTLIAVLGLVVFTAAGQATHLSPFIDLQEKGLKLAGDGEGLTGWDGTARTLSVNIGGNVRFALLYWAGRERGCTIDGTNNCPFVEPYKDQQVIFNGTSLTGTVIGHETQPVTGIGEGPAILNIGYFADVTSLVSAAYSGPGLHNFTFADGNGASNLWRINGAGILIGYTDAADPSVNRVIIWDGLDSAFGPDPTPGETRVTAATNLNHGINLTPRAATLWLFMGDGTFDRPDHVTISNNATSFNALDGSSGNQWDTDTLPINIPAGTGMTTVQVHSAPNNANPDSLLWEVVALEVEQLDFTAPTCPTQLFAGPPAQAVTTFQDTGTGLAELLVTRSENADTVVPPFTVGTNDPVVVTSTKIDQTKRSRIEIRATDLAGNSRICDPIHVLVVRENGRPVEEISADVPAFENKVTIMNGSPGLNSLEVIVNGKKFKASGLKDGQTVTLDISSAMIHENNSITLRGHGKKGATADVFIWDGVSQ